MSDYQRFVSYLYEYKNSLKAQNRGFLKAESRNGYFKLELHIKDVALPSGIPVDIYGYLRESGMLLGILLGTVQSRNGAITCRIESPCSFSEFPQVSFSSLKGIIVLCNHAFSYASAWDDLPIEPEKFSTTLPEATVPLEEHTPSENMVPASSGEPDLTVEEIASSDASWKKALDQYEHFQPFNDEFISDCVKIDLKDLPALRKDHWLIGNNPFIMRAYAEHQHFILGHIVSEDQNTYIFGVPGTYHPKEKFMAEMYGFPYFKAVQQLTDSTLSSGYWYRPLS